MTPDPRLLLPATRALLEGWCGPVVVGDSPEVWVCLGTVDEDGDPRVTDGVRPMYYDFRHIRLDLSRAECRDRVARVVAGALLRDIPPNGDGFTWRCEQFCWEVKSHNTNWRAGFAADTSGWFARDEGNRTGRFPSRSVPALAALDPTDDTRLPDGSRRVDALALAAVARQVLTPGGPNDPR